jgi:Family of unknown function (DUF6498)
MADAIPAPVSFVYRALSLLLALATLIGNLIPLYGVLYWGWDTFQLLMLYWTETAIIAGFTLLRLSRLSGPERGEITVNGKPQDASQFMLVGFFALHAGIFIFVHLILLWAFFSWDWLKKVHGVGSFFFELYGANYIWAALLFMVIASAVSFLVESGKPAERSVGADGKATDRVLPIVGGLYARIVIMQVAIIFGAIISGMAGSLAPLVIVIVLKTLVDVGGGFVVSTVKTMSLSGNDKKLKIEM